MRAHSAPSSFLRPGAIGLVGVLLAALVLTLVAPTSAGAASLSYRPATTFAVGDTPYSVAVADLNGDSNADLAVANVASDDVSVLLGQGDGTFGPATNVALEATPSGDGPYSVAVADFNGDTKMDLAATNAEADSVSVLLGDGKGRFGPPTSFAVGRFPRAVAVVDLNGDGHPDLATGAHADGKNVSVLLGRGDGTFGAATSVPGSNGCSLALADLNGDTKPDLAVGRPGSVSVLLGQGGGRFGSPTSFPVEDSPCSVAVADLNGDATPDLATANGYRSTTVSVLLGQGGGRFGPATSFPVGDSPYWVAAADLNGDATPDLATANSGSGNVSVLLGHGDGRFDPAASFPTGLAPVFVAAADFNGDAKPDLATANAEVHNVSVLLQVNRPPVAVADSYSVPEDTPLRVAGSEGLLGNDSDPDGDRLTATLVAPPTWGSLTAFGGDGSFTFTPLPDRSGTVTVRYAAHDGPTGMSAPAPVTITVTPVNDPPVAVKDDLAIPFGASGTIDVAANDRDADEGDGERLSVGRPSDPESGTATCADRSCTYTPDPLFIGDDTFTYTLSDPAGATDTATVTVRVAAPTAPGAADDTATTAEDTPTTVPVTANDTPGQLRSTLTLSAPAAHGTATCADTDCSYSPAAGYHGPDTFAYTLTDTAGQTSTATVAMTVTAVNHPPTLIAPAQTLGIGATPAPLTGRDPDDDPLTYATVDGALPAGITLNPDGTFAGTATAYGRTTARLTACDPSGACVEADQPMVVRPGDGYWMLAADGEVFPLGASPVLGGVGDGLGGARAVDIDTPAGRRGYWVLDDRGGVHPVGDALALGALQPGSLLPGERAVALTATPTGGGYRIVTSAGRVVAFGDATHHGDLVATGLAAPIVDAAATNTGQGYWLVARDGAVFAFGDARYAGGLTGTALIAPIVGIAADPDGTGYWLAAADGGVFTFDAPFRGSMAPTALNGPVVRIRRYGAGYLLAAADGGIFVFSDRLFVGSLGNRPPPDAITSVAVPLA